MAATSARDIALRWIELYNDGTPESYGSDRFLELYAPDADWREMPTRAYPEGRSGGVETVREAVVVGQATLRNRRVTLNELVAEGEKAAFFYTWRATAAIDLPEPLNVQAGGAVQLEVAQFIEVANGKIQKSVEHVVLARA